MAGINEKYNKEVCDHLVELIEAGEYDKAEELATEFIASDTDVVVTWSKLPAIEFYLRDSVFNRGHARGAKILQMALGVEPDGVVGARTRAVLAVPEQNPSELGRRLAFSIAFFPLAAASSLASCAAARRHCRTTPSAWHSWAEGPFLAPLAAQAVGD